MSNELTRRVTSHPRWKRATGVGSFKSYQLTKEDPHPCHTEGCGISRFALIGNTCYRRKMSSGTGSWEVNYPDSLETLRPQ
jgi:hypothetical protein